MLESTHNSNKKRSEEKRLMDIGNRLMMARKACYLTRQELSVRCGISEHTIQSWEVGRRIPKAKNLYAIINIFRECGYHTSVSWLLNNNELIEEENDSPQSLHLTDPLRHLPYDEIYINQAIELTKDKLFESFNINFENFLQELTNNYFKLLRNNK